MTLDDLKAYVENDINKFNEVRKALYEVSPLKT